MESLIVIILLFLLNYDFIELIQVMALLLGFFFMHNLKNFDTVGGSLALIFILVLAVGFLLDAPSSYLFVLVGVFLYALKAYLM